MTTIRTAAGDELTEQDIEALADEAERGYDLSKARVVRVGRPALSSSASSSRSKGPSPRVQVRVDRQLAKALKARARSEKRSVSEIARTALQQYIDHAA